MKKIYLDYAASTPVAPEVFTALKPYFSLKFGNPGSLHSFGQEAMAAVDLARERVARATGADFREIVFTGSATEANNLALRGAVNYAMQIMRMHANAANSSHHSNEFVGWHRPKLIVSAIEHESVLETARDLEKDGVEIAVIPVDESGIVDLGKLAAALDERTVLVSIMFVNNEIGRVQPTAKIAKILAKFRDAKSMRKHANAANNSHHSNEFVVWHRYPLFHTDASQTPVYFDCGVKKLGVDLMTLSSQKVYGPKGVGALFIKNQESGIRNREPIIHNSKFLIPEITGGGQEFGLRSGTENAPGIVGFGKAMELATRNRGQETRKVTAIKNHFWEGLKKVAPGVQINGASDAPHILNVYFPNAYAGDLLTQLDIAGVAASSGSACSARAFTPSHVLAALGLPGERIRGSVRFSFGTPTTKKEINEAIRRMGKILNSKS